MTDFGNTHLGADDYRPLDWNKRDRTGSGVGGAGSTPTDWVEWEVASTEGPYAWNSGEEEVLWTADLGSVSHGSAIVLTSGHAEVATDGWYTLSGFVYCDAVTATAVYDLARIRLRVFRSFAIGGDSQDDVVIVTECRPSSGQTGSVYYEARLPFSWTGYLKAGDTARVYVQMSAASNPGSNWQVRSGGAFDMQKLPL